MIQLAGWEKVVGYPLWLKIPTSINQCLGRGHSFSLVTGYL
jgi:hypothetical protein